MLPAPAKTLPRSSSSPFSTINPPFTRNCGNSTTAQTTSKASSSTTKTSSVRLPFREALSARNPLEHLKTPPKSKWSRNYPGITYNSVQSALSWETTMLPFKQSPKPMPWWPNVSRAVLMNLRRSGVGNARVLIRSICEWVYWLGLPTMTRRSRRKLRVRMPARIFWRQLTFLCRCGAMLNEGRNK